MKLIALLCLAFLASCVSTKTQNEVDTSRLLVAEPQVARDRAFDTKATLGAQYAAAVEEGLPVTEIARLQTGLRLASQDLEAAEEALKRAQARLRVAEGKAKEEKESGMAMLSLALGIGLALLGVPGKAVMG